MGFFLVIGRKLFLAQKDEIAKEKHRKQLEKRGYVFGAYADKDSIQKKIKEYLRPRRCAVKLLIFGWSELLAIVYEEYPPNEILGLSFVEQYKLRVTKRGLGVRSLLRIVLDSGAREQRAEKNTLFISIGS